MKSQKDDLLTKILASVTIGSCVLTLMGLTLTMNRGFDFFDDGFYLASLKDTNPGISFTASFLYLRPAFLLLSENIAIFRILGLFMLATTAFLFARCFLAWSSPSDQSASYHRVVIACLISSSMMYYFYLLRTPGYNLVIACLSYLVLAGLLAIETKQLFRVKQFLTFGCGIVTAVTLFVKLTVFPIALIVCSSFIATLPTLSGRQRSSLLMLYSLGLASWLTCHFLLLQSPLVWWTQESGSLAYIQALNTSHGSIALWRYIVQSWHSSLQALIIALPSLAVIAVGRMLKQHIPISNMMILSVLVNMCFLLFHGYYAHWGVHEPLITAYCSFLIVALACLGSNINTVRDFSLNGSLKRRTAILFMIASFPFATAIGTSNELFSNAMFAMAPLIAIILYLYKVLAERTGTNLLVILMTSIISLLILVQIGAGTLQPYGMNSSLWRQTKAIEITAGNRLYVDASTRDFIISLMTAAKKAGMHAQSDLLLFYDYPGIAYVLNAHILVTPWYFSYSPKAVRALLEQVPTESLKQAYIVDLENATIPSTGASIPAGASLPPELSLETDYRLVAKVQRREPQQTFDIWAPYSNLNTLPKPTSVSR